MTERKETEVCCGFSGSNRCYCYEPGGKKYRATMPGERKETVEDVVAEMRRESVNGYDYGGSFTDPATTAARIEAAHAKEIAEKDEVITKQAEALQVKVRDAIADTEAIRKVAEILNKPPGSYFDPYKLAAVLLKAIGEESTEAEPPAADR